MSDDFPINMLFGIYLKNVYLVQGQAIQSFAEIYRETFYCLKNTKQRELF